MNVIHEIDIFSNIRLQMLTKLSFIYASSWMALVVELLLAFTQLVIAGTYRVMFIDDCITAVVKPHNIRRDFGSKAVDWQKND